MFYCTQIVLEEALDLSSDRILNERMNGHKVHVELDIKCVLYWT